MLYTLYNKHLDKKLTHPKYGLWCTPDKNEATEMLKACREYLIAIRVPTKEFDNFVIWDVEKGEEVPCE